MNLFKLPETVALDELDTVIVSTVDLRSFSWGGAKYETCLFWHTGDSQVQGRWHSLDQAMAEHRRLVMELRPKD